MRITNDDSPWMRDLNCRCGIRRLQRKAAAHLQTSVAIGAAGRYGEALLRSVHGQGRPTRHEELCYLVEKRQQRDPSHSRQDSSAQRVSVSEQRRPGYRCWRHSANKGPATRSFCAPRHNRRTRDNRYDSQRNGIIYGIMEARKGCIRVSLFESAGQGKAAAAILEDPRCHCDRRRRRRRRPAAFMGMHSREWG